MSEAAKVKGKNGSFLCDIVKKERNSASLLSQASRCKSSKCTVQGK